MDNSTLESIARREFFLIAGPCAAESTDICLRTAEHVAELAQKKNLPFVFKSSFTKANRLSAGSYSGPGIDDGLKILQTVKERLGLPIITDIHETHEIAAVAEVADILQIPAFLCRQTDLLMQAAATGKWVNIKKGQFLSPEDMGKIAAKAGTDKVMLTERGTSFGYHTLVVDFRSLPIMRKTGYQVIYDVTHSLQLPGGAGAVSTGQPEFVIPMAKAAAAIGMDGLFVETHPNPSEAKSDAGAMLPLKQMADLIEAVLQVREASQ